jgi:transposase InsO family protein
MEIDKKEKIALFRFGIIHPLIGLKSTQKTQKNRLLKEITEREWDIPYSNRSHICRATVLEWLKKYRDSGDNISSLHPKSRNDSGRPRVMDEDTERTLVNLKSSYPTASLETLLRLAKSKGFLPPDFNVAPQTIYRVFQRHQLSKPTSKDEDSRKFQSELPNDLWQSDCMHGPTVVVDGKSRKSYLFAILDDHSRLITHAEFYLNENIECYQHCLQTALAKRGLPRKLYLDNGAAFRSHHLRYTTASLGIALIHARPYRPQGKGKIERWFRTVQTQWLPLLPERITLTNLNTRLWEWIDHEYHQRIHSSIQSSPLQAFTKKLHLLRSAPQHLNDIFRKAVLRKVQKDRTISLNGVEYEAPLGLIGNTVTLRYHSQDLSRIEVFDADRSYGFLSVLNPQINAHLKRETNEERGPRSAIQAFREEESGQRYRGGELFDGGDGNE